MITSNNVRAFRKLASTIKSRFGTHNIANSVRRIPGAVGGELLIKPRTVRGMAVLRFDSFKGKMTVAAERHAKSPPAALLAVGRVVIGLGRSNSSMHLLMFSSEIDKRACALFGGARPAVLEGASVERQRTVKNERFAQGLAGQYSNDAATVVTIRSGVIASLISDAEAQDRICDVCREYWRSKFIRLM
jgi:hypothetical protein